MAAESSYSPGLRTAVVLCGAGTAGAYQAGVLRAFHEAGVKIDVVAAHGAGVLNALCAAIDGGARLWAADGPWTAAGLARSYRWRPSLRVAAAALLFAAAILLSPILVLLVAAVAYALSLLASLVNLTGLAAWLVEVYGQTIGFLLHPPIVPTIVPRAVVLGVITVFVVLVVAAVDAWRREPSRRRLRGAFWWRLVGAPLGAEEPAGTAIDTLWRLVRGASSEPRPAPAELGRRYLDTLTDNLGQPGFRELLLGVHDVDSRRDLVGGVLAPSSLAAFQARRSPRGPREAEILAWNDAARSVVVDFLLGALRQPIASPPHAIEFPADSYWQGERHFLVDRPEILSRLIDEIAAIGVEQVIFVSAATAAAVPHAMRSRPLDLRGRMGEVLRSIETAALHDACTAAATRFSGVFLVRPAHNPVGPFDFQGVYDESSDRVYPLADLMEHGYRDAYQQFIEPVVAAGDRVEV